MNFTTVENKAVAAAQQSNIVIMRNAIVGLIDRLINGAQAKHYEYEIVFGAQAAGLGEHGRIVGTWVKEGHPREISITFFIKGFEHQPPKLDRHLIEELYEQAAFNGIIMSHISGYASITAINLIPRPAVSGVIVNQRKHR